MECTNHPEREANFRCVDCGKPICKECAINQRGKIVCKECTSEEEILERQNLENINITRESPKTYNSFWAVLFSLLPGAGHMYLGLMKRGLQLMIAFFAMIIIPNIFYSIDYLTVIALIIWFYSLFDAHHIRKRIKKGDTINDDLIYDMDVSKFNYYNVGIGLVVFGSIVFLSEVLRRLHYMFNYEIVGLFRELMFPGLLIVGGIILLKKSKNDNEEIKENLG
ncbi:MAG: hypothetical protein FH751_01795 [Firmicutes bacterium]|nr:hypothetical protein [Bacillota bacterium]